MPHSICISDKQWILFKVFLVKKKNWTVLCFFWKPYPRRHHGKNEQWDIEGEKSKWRVNESLDPWEATEAQSHHGPSEGSCRIRLTIALSMGVEAAASLLKVALGNWLSSSLLFGPSNLSQLQKMPCERFHMTLHLYFAALFTSAINYFVIIFNALISLH